MGDFGLSAEGRRIERGIYRALREGVMGCAPKLVLRFVTGLASFGTAIRGEDGGV